ncbi:50S ribosomal protein L21 [Patescibacteria group bacterium]
MKYAVIKTGGKQYKVSENETLEIEKVAEDKKKITFDEVLLVVSDKKVKVGKPFLAKTKVEAEIVAQFKDKKIRVAKFRAKSKYRKVKGHRQQKTKIKILKISAPK